MVKKAGGTGPLIVFADDWGRHPSSSQHLIGQLLHHHEVYWVNTIGMRKPRLDLATLRRGFAKIRGWLNPTQHREGIPVNLHVSNPKMWPWFSSAFDRWLNRRLLERQLASLIHSMGASPIVITTLPIVADLIGILPVRRWVYYCVDDFGQWPGLDRVPLQAMEKRLVEKADTLVAVSETLRDRLARMGRTAHLLTHGVNLEFWSLGISQHIAIPQLQQLERPLVAFWGLIDRRMDVGFVKRLSADLSKGTIVLVGPESDPDPGLYASKRVVHLPPLPYEWLPQLAQEAAVLVMPYADLPVTQAIQPLKLKEYLATGKPTVVRDLPAVRAWADCLDIVDTPEKFSQAVRRRALEGLPDVQKQGRERLAQESWSEKARTFERWILAEEPSQYAVACS